MKTCLIANPQAVHTQRWARALAERGHDVHVIGVRSAEVAGVTVHSVLDDRKARASALVVAASYVHLGVRLRSLLHRLRPDVVVAHYTTTNGVLAVLTRTHPLVITPWGTDIRPEPTVWKRVLRDHVNAWVLRGADAVAVSSQYLATRVTSVAGGRCALPMIIPFGVDTDRFSPESSPRSPSPLRIGFIKHFKPRYGTEVLLDAIPAVLAAIPEARVILAGSGPLEATLREQAAMLGIEESVEFLGPVPHDEVPSLMRSLDLLVNPSLEESFGVVLLEAASSARPVVSSDVGGVREVVEDGVTGLLVPPGNPSALATAIIRIGLDRDLRRQMGDAGRRRVLESFDWTHSVDAMDALFRDVIDTPPKPRLTWVRTSARRLETLPLVNRTVRPALRWAWDLLWHAIIQIRVLRGGPVAVLDLDVGEVTVDLRDTGVARPLCRYREYEPDERSAMRQLVVPGMHAVDIGAQIGYHTLLLSQLVGDDGRVLAIEAAPDNFTLLEHNIQHNGRANVTAVNVAAADRPGELNLAIDPSNLGAHHVVRSASDTDAIAVSAETVDAIANREQLRPQFVKMDIEGGEVTALHGMATMIDGEDMTFLAELNGAALERAGTSSAALLVEFADHGYQFFSVETGGRLSRTSQEALLAAASRRPNLNFVAARGPALLRIKNALEH